jgi:hypothetical protein
MIVERMAATVPLNSWREPMPSARVFPHWHRSGRVSLSRLQDADIRAQETRLDGSDGIHTDGTGQVGEVRAHTIDPAMSSAQSVNVDFVITAVRTASQSKSTQQGQLFVLVRSSQTGNLRHLCGAFPLLIRGIFRWLFSDGLQEFGSFFFAASFAVCHEFLGLL